MKILNLRPMRAVEVRTPGPPEVLVLGEAPRPQPLVDQVLIEVAAAGVNRPDLLQRRGVYPPPHGVTETLGLDVAGTIVAVGPDVARWHVGDEVCALVAGGGYAEYCIAPESQCLPVPRGLSMVEAASLPETYFTVWSNVFDRGRLERDEVFLIHGGASGIGVAAIQMARALGARVFATAGSADKCAACEQLGALRAINRHIDDFVEVVRDHTHGHGADVILDMVAGSYTARNLEVLAEDGRLVLIATLDGAEAQVDLRRVMTRRLTITGSTLRGRSSGFKGAIARRLEEVIWPLLEAGTIKPMIHAVFPLARAADAHAELERGKHVGKIVLSVKEPAGTTT
ncbi:MAG TPA: NAD(P)H-quinone oxidoreductase [Gemmatimonadaceae bacterium]|jgi:NADPH2:quinone reductase|nr:NAD(P)H-quinone oxidoreductase [Gemmatimonadaceae bacterium]